MKKRDLKLILAKIERLEAAASPLHLPIEEELLDNYDMFMLLKCSSSTLKRYRNKGIIPCVKIGNKHYYPKRLLMQTALESIIKKDDQSKRFDD
ncbi:MAG: hypothetical protein DCF13_13270 [Flavobacteriaceae bacterium]|nr:MAG: hypothetical protein DCF13_13270 [Flavobacteriaceae bacterium]